MTDERDDLVVLVDENGEEVQFEHLDTIELDEKEYVVLIPYNEDDNVAEDAVDEEEEVVILRIEHNDDGEDSFISIENEDELNSVFEEFKDRMEEEFDFNE
jgi:uncharacterized protein YrzB (UPF0473 family)